jgi:DNA-directed RNA polymerase specialized sigma24 family protein
MATNLGHSVSTSSELYSDNCWIVLYSLLVPLVKRWVYSSRVYVWAGQESDIVCDIVQVAIQRTFEYALKALRNGISIISLESLSITIARNYYRDLLRKERRLVHFAQEDSLPGNRVSLSDLVDPSEIAFEMMYIDWLFTQIANAVVTFPDRTRTALLIDLASRMHFDNAEPTALQRAFLEVGIRLQDYQNLLPKDTGAKSRHASLVSIAYKRLRIAICLRQYDPAA